MAGCSVPDDEPLAVPSVTPVADPILLKHGWDVPSPDFVRANVASMEQMPFDGITIAMPGLSNQVQRQVRVGYERFRDALQPVASTRFTTFEHNFVVVYSTPADDLFADWSIPARNFANLARAAKEAGFEGIFYDNEEYFGDAVDYPGSCADRSVSECQARAALRGEQVMDAMRAEWPEVRVLSTLGPWISDPATASNLRGVPYNDVAAANQLIGSFAAGMVASAAGTQARYVDGGEIYTARTALQFATVKAWQKEGMASRGSVVPSSLRPVWADAVLAAYGVYDRPWLGVAMDPATWRSTLTNALATTDAYVWAYTEGHDWWGVGHPAEAVPPDWVAATRAARASR